MTTSKTRSPAPRSSGKLTIDKAGFNALHFGVATTDREKMRDLVNNTLNGGADYYSGTNAINVGDLDGDVISHSFPCRIS